MTTYYRLLILTALISAFLTFCVLQTISVNSSAATQKQPQQLQSTPQPRATEYYAMGQSRMMTLVWQPYGNRIGQPQHVAFYRTV